MDKFKISTAEALAKLGEAQKPFIKLFAHGSLEVEVYQPDKVDLQEPHDRDEIYVVIAGTGTFYLEGERVDFKAGDFLFVPAGKVHRFEDFSEDFSTWVFFYGPVGGEI